MIEGHGDDAYRYGNKVIHNFSTNIHQGADHSALISHIAASASLLGNYPEPSPASLEARLAGMSGVASDAVLVTNGATEAIYLIADLWRGSRSAIMVPAFREYEDACAMHGHSIVPVATTAEIPVNAATAWICNPSNPTGRVTDIDTLLRTVASHPSTLFVIDQAYADYTSCRVMTPQEAVDAGNVILLSSFTKRFAVPGLRIGYCTGAPEVISRLRGRRMPWSVGALSLEAAGFLLDNRHLYPIDAEGLHAEAMRIARELSASGIETESTDCNFILCRLPRGKASDLKEWLVEIHGILIRDASNFTTLTPAHFRVAAQSPAQNDLLINAIRQWITSTL